MILNALNNTRAVRAVAPACRLAPLAAAVALCFAGSVSAATIMVNDATVHGLPDPLHASCTIVDAATSINQGSLVATSNCLNNGSAFGTNDTIDLSTFAAPTTITFNPASATTTTTTMTASSALALTKPLTISGNLDSNGKPLVKIEHTIESPIKFRVIDTTSNLTLHGITLNNGHATTDGGAIQAAGATHPSLTLTNSIVTGSTADGSGGGIYADGVVTLNNSTVVGNTASGIGGGGGIYAADALGSVIANNSTFSDNTTSGDSGGGINAYSVTLTNTTVSNNSAQTSGGGVFAQNITLDFSTISNNASNVGGGVALSTALNSPTFTATATLIYGNNNSGNNIDSGGKPRTLAGDHNLIDTSSRDVTLPLDTLSCDPVLDALADNGGPTQTHALPAGSCAIDAGPTFPPGTIPSDQRGNAYARRVDAATDIGAFEAQKSDRIFYDGFGL